MENSGNGKRRMEKVRSWKEVSGKWRGQGEINWSMAEIMDLIFKVWIDLI